MVNLDTKVKEASPDAAPDAALPAVLTRAGLFDLVWSRPLRDLAARFGVSDSYLSRICRRLAVPTPGRGHWAQMAAGRKLKRPMLPAAPPGASRVESVGGHVIRGERPAPAPAGAPKRRRPVRGLPATHPLVAKARPLFLKGRLSRTQHLKPSKRLLTDVVVSEALLDKALALANALYLAFEVRGHAVALAAAGEGGGGRPEIDVRRVPGQRPPWYQCDLWGPWRATVAHVDGVLFGLTVVETTEEVAVRHVHGKTVREADYRPAPRDGYTFTSTEEVPTGRLRLYLYASTGHARWVRTFDETGTRDLAGQVKTVVRLAERSVPEIARLIEAGRCRAEAERQEREAQWERWEREREARRVAKARADSQVEILEIMAAWAEAARIEAFFKLAEERAMTLDAERRARLLDRLRLARELIGSVDALDHFSAWRSPEERLSERRSFP